MDNRVTIVSQQFQKIVHFMSASHQELAAIVEKMHKTSPEKAELFNEVNSMIGDLVKEMHTHHTNYIFKSKKMQSECLTKKSYYEF